MSYEEQVRFKHAVEDALMELVFYASLLSDRELELAIAKLGDVAQHESDSSVKDHLVLKGVILHYVRELRSKQHSKQNKAKRLWFARKKGQIRREVAEHHRTPIKLAYEEELKKLEEKNRKRHQLYVKASEGWKAELAKIPFLKRLFGRVPPRPAPPVPERPDFLPPSISHYELKLFDLDFGGLLIERIVIHIIPSVEIGREFATEENIRSYDLRLLERSK